MAQRSEIATVYAAGLIQGVALVTFPAAGTVFTSAADYGLSSTEYGGLFLPQAILAIVSSLAGAGLSARWGVKQLYLLGLTANLLAMSLLVASRFVMHDHAFAYDLLLSATSCMGLGFGLTVPALNTLAAAFFPQTVDKAVLALNALLGLGTALAPIFIALFVGFGVWWGLPVLVAALLVGLLIFSFGQPLKADQPAHPQEATAKKGKFPARFWVFAGFALLYGVCETMNGNWASIYLTREFHASPALASLALTLFWAMVTAGRVLFALLEKWFPERRVGPILPLVMALAFVASACVPKTQPVLGILSFGLAGLGCSALLPLTISFGQRELTTLAASVAGALIAFYQIGYGLAAFGVGPLQSWAGLSLEMVYGGMTVAALLLAALACVLVSPPRKKETLLSSPALKII